MVLIVVMQEIKRIDISIVIDELRRISDKTIFTRVARRYKRGRNMFTLVNVYVDLLVFTRIAGTS